MSAPVQSGFFHRDGVNLVGRVTDVFGFIVDFTGVPWTQDGVRGWSVTAVVTAPEGLRIPFIDDDGAPP
jgi:hypothetical protein